MHKILGRYQLRRLSGNQEALQCRLSPRDEISNMPKKVFFKHEGDDPATFPPLLLPVQYHDDLVAPAVAVPYSPPSSIHTSLTMALTRTPQPTVANPPAHFDPASKPPSPAQARPKPQRTASSDSHRHLRHRFHVLQLPFLRVLWL